jgi:type IV pilus assembly protein PilY1
VADTSTVPKCTQAEEQQNFANWFTYYRTRNLLARGSLSEAFSNEGNTFRVGFGRINKGSASVDGVDTKALESDTANYGGGGVRALDATRKGQLYKWIQDLPASGGTPLPDAMYAVGEYFSRTDDKGPWTDSPGVAGNTVANNKTCRRSYNVIMTDGYWNANANSKIYADPATKKISDANSDNTDGLTIISSDGLKTFQFKASTKPYTDGTTYTLADYAMHYWKTDLQPATANAVVPMGENVSFWQNLTNFTIGLGVTGSLNPNADLPALTAGTKSWPAATTSGNQYNVDDLWHAAVNSRGQYFSAKDPAELSNALSSALGTAVGGSSATAGVATASTVLEATNRKYVPTYISGIWSGEVTALPLDVNGQQKSAVWTASTKSPVKPVTAGGTDWNQRKIYTWDPNATGGAQAVPFTWATISSQGRSAMGSVATTYTTRFVDFIRGDHSNEGTALASPFRLRVDAKGAPFVLGDFINSTPVFLRGDLDSDYSRLPTGGSSYASFLTYKSSRLGVLMVGANDGMLHGFQDSKVATATDGQESFAYVPRAVYPNLSMLADKTYGTTALPHQYFVDGPQTEADAYVRAPGPTPGTFAASATWRNFLLGSLGAGGRAVYGLDVTDTSNLGASSVRWEISNADDADVGYVVAPIDTGVLPNGKWVAVFGNGNFSGSGKATLFIVDVETGSFKKLTVDATGSNGLGGVALQKDAQGQLVRVYAGDQKGNMWRMDYDATATSTGFFKTYQEGGVDKPLYVARTTGGVNQPISQPPILYDHSLGGTLVVFGTGQLLSTTDASDQSVQSLYGIWDKISGGVLDTWFARPLVRSNLASRTVYQYVGANSALYYGLSGTAVNWTSQRGWVVDLAQSATAGGIDFSGLRTINPPQKVTFELALIGAVAPAQTAAVCVSTDGKGINFLFAVEQGSNPTFSTIDTNGDGVVNASDTPVAGYATTADGIDRVIYSAKKDSTMNGATTGADGQCGPGFFQASIQNASGQVLTCMENGPSGGGGGGGGGPHTMKDRVQRRIINPPIR